MNAARPSTRASSLLLGHDRGAGARVNQAHLPQSPAPAWPGSPAPPVSATSRGHAAPAREECSVVASALGTSTSPRLKRRLTTALPNSSACSSVSPRETGVPCGSVQVGRIVTVWFEGEYQGFLGFSISHWARHRCSPHLVETGCPELLSRSGDPPRMRLNRRFYHVHATLDAKVLILVRPRRLHRRRLRRANLNPCWSPAWRRAASS